MVNASLNWSSICGLLLVLFWLPATVSGVYQLWFVLTRRSDTTPNVLLQSALRVILIFGRGFSMPAAGVGLFFQGWRLDPILQLIVFLLIIGIIAEMTPSFVDDYRKWRHRNTNEHNFLKGK